MDVASVTKEAVLLILEDLRVGIPFSKVAAERVVRKEPKSAQTQKHVLALLGTMWRYARDCKYVDEDFPGAKIKLRFENARHFFFTEAQVKAVLADLRGNADNLPLQKRNLKGGAGGNGSLDA